GFYVVGADVLFPLVGELRPDNAQGEFYLTDMVALAARAGRRVRTVEVGRPEEVTGINTRAELARMEATLKGTLVERWMEAGVTFEDPATVYLGPEVTIGRDSVIGPNVQLRGRTRIGEGCRLEGTAYIQDATIGARVQIGSDTQLVAPVAVGDDAYVGAGTTVTHDVPSGALAVSRSPQRHLEGWTMRRRAREDGASEAAAARTKPRAGKRRTRA